MTIQMKAIEKYFHAILFIMLKVAQRLSLWMKP